MYTKKFVITGIFCVLVTTLFLTFRTVPQATLDLKNTAKASGTIEKVLKSGTNNVVLKLKNDDRMYYLELNNPNHASLASLKQEFVGQPVEIYYQKQWISPTQRPGFHHIARVNLYKTPILTPTAW